MLKVSCIMPAAYGKMALVAVQCFLNQTYENRELIILDNNKEGETIKDLIPNDDRIIYRRVKRMPVGYLRNQAASLATGEIICSWDCDDWYADNRIEEQVKRLEESGKSVTGWHSILYYEVSNGNTYKYFYDPNHNHPSYAMGTSQCYFKSWWEKHKYIDIDGSEDYPFQLEALHLGQLDSCDGGKLAVARAHSDSTCFPTQLGKHKQFPVFDRSEFPPEFYSAIEPKVVAKPATTQMSIAKPRKKEKQQLDSNYESTVSNSTPFNQKSQGEYNANN